MHGSLMEVNINDIKKVPETTYPIKLVFNSQEKSESKL